MPDSNIPENERARQWREANGLSQQALAKLTGFAQSTIADFERGHGHSGRPIPNAAWTRYRNACAAITVRPFQWDRPARKRP